VKFPTEKTQRILATNLNIEVPPSVAPPKDVKEIRRVRHESVVDLLNLDPVLIPVVPRRAVGVPVCDPVRKAVE
jgi:hypothetical protein